MKSFEDLQDVRKEIVASFAEAWIEIKIIFIYFSIFKSPPSRRRGLKYLLPPCLLNHLIVASFAEAWIEINVSHKLLYEILPSPPSRRRGLKSKVWRHLYNGNAVASFAEAWIEIEI